MSVARSLREWVFIQAYNNRLLTTEKVADECKANKLVDKRSRKKWRSLFSLLEDKNHAHQVYKKNQMHLSFSLFVCRRTFPSNLKALKTNVICYMAKQE